MKPRHIFSLFACANAITTNNWLATNNSHADPIRECAIFPAGLQTALSRKGYVHGIGKLHLACWASLSSD